MTITAKELKVARFMAKLTQAELAEKVGVAQRTVVNWERADGRVPRRSEEAVIKALGTDLRGVSSQTGDPGKVTTVAFIPESTIPVEAEPEIEFIFRGNTNPDPEVKKAVAQILGALDLADRASKYAIDPIYLVRFLESLANIMTATGLSSSREVPDGSNDVLAHLLGESKRILSNVIKDYPSLLKHFDESFSSAIISFDGYVKTLDEIKRQYFVDRAGVSGKASESKEEEVSLHRNGGDLSSEN